ASARRRPALGRRPWRGDRRTGEKSAAWFRSSFAGRSKGASGWTPRQRLDRSPPARRSPRPRERRRRTPRRIAAAILPSCSSSARRAASSTRSSASCGWWDWDLTSDELVWSDGCKALFGLAAGARVTYDAFLARVHPEDRTRVEEAVHRSLE